MKSILPWFCLAALTNTVYANPGLDAYRLGNYDKAANLLSKSPTKDAITDYYIAKMRLYGYGELKNNEIAISYFESAAENGLLFAQKIMARYELIGTGNLEKALYWFKKAADKDDTSALMYCAGAYYYGLGVQQNRDKAKKYYIAAAKNGNSIAQYSVARSFLNTKNMGNKKLGMIWLNKSIQQNNPAAQLLMAKQYIEGKMVEKDLNKARELINLAITEKYLPAYYQMGQLSAAEEKYTEAKDWYNKAAIAEYIPAMIALSNLYANEKTPLFNNHDSYLWMLKAAQLYSESAALQLSQMYQKGIETEADENLAKTWQIKAKEFAKNSVTKSKVKAVHWLTDRKKSDFAETDYRLRGILTSWNNKNSLRQNNYNQAPQMDKLAKKDIYKPQFTLINPNTIPISEFYDILVASKQMDARDRIVYPAYVVPAVGQQTEKNKLDLKRQITSLGFDYLLAESKNNSSIDFQGLFKKLLSQAELGDTAAQFDVALMYQNGVGVGKNIEEAIKFYNLAASQDNLASMYQLGIIYLLGIDGVFPDYKLSQTYLNNAAFKGNDFAEFVLAQIYENGYKDKDGKEVIPKDIGQAIALYNVAAANNLGLAQYRLAEIMVHSKPTDISVNGKEKRNKTIKRLYEQALANNVNEARLPLAFYNAMDNNKEKQQFAYDSCQKDVDDGNKYAALLLGLMYDRGIIVEADKSTAIKWYEKAGDNPVSAFILGTYRANGDGLSKDLEVASGLLQKAVNAEFSYANLNLAVLNKQQNKEFLPNLNKALLEGNSIAGLLLADYYLSNSKDESQLKEAHTIYQQFADKGDKNAQLKLGYLYENGIGGNIDYAKAEMWYTESAKQDQPLSQYLLARLYQLGNLPNGPDYQLAKKWYKLSQASYAPAAVAIGFLYDTEDEDYQGAMAEYQYANVKGDIIGAFNLGLLYERGEQCQVDYKKAKDLYLKAAEAGHKESMVQLAGLYLNGYGVSVDAKEAYKWYKLAAEKGDRDAMYQLGLMNETGLATKIDSTLARKYYQQAASLGNEKANLALARLS